MVFNSITFVVFFGVVLLVYAMPLPWRFKKAHLLVASYLFYAAWNPPFVILIWISTLVDWYAARRIKAATTLSFRRSFLLVSLVTNLGILGFFKYGDFLLENFVWFAATLGIEFQPADLGIFLPIGISFYTFQTLSYTIDVYRRRMEPWNSFLDFALFVTFFPQLVAGPIVRASHFLPQCLTPRRVTANGLSWGFALLTLGLFEKAVLADSLMAPVADLVYASPMKAGFIDAWAGTLAFSAQIFFDFAGYSTCAIGAALCLGFHLPENFRYPYAAIGFSDFWRRWHVSLSTWLRDYLYIPLGGNRRGRRRTYINLMLTMLLGGLWHGAAWRFVAWGGMHGLFLSAERLLRGRLPHIQLAHSRLARVAAGLLTYYLTCLTWTFFRATDFTGALHILRAMFFGTQDQMETGLLNVTAVAILTALTLCVHWFMRERSLEEVAASVPWWIRGTVLALMLIAVAMVRGGDRAFIYFQF
jgi:D-alanyl-lipoteichoic acid acyltransferase DltB (MBOAT superfamily)